MTIYRNMMTYVWTNHSHIRADFKVHPFQKSLELNPSHFLSPSVDTIATMYKSTGIVRRASIFSNQIRRLKKEKKENEKKRKKSETEVQAKASL